MGNSAGGAVPGSAARRSPAGLFSGLRSLFRRWATEERNAAQPQIDPVDCTVFAPPAAAPRQAVRVQIFAHPPGEGASAANTATDPKPATIRSGFRRLEIDVERGAELRFRLEMPHLAVNNRVQSFLWAGSPGVAQFDVTVPGEAAGATVNGTVRVDLDTVPIGLIKFKLDILAIGLSPPPSEPRGDVAYPFRKAFISYATSDRADVLKRVPMLTQLQIDFFREVLNAEPRERWEKQLYHYIDECDLFLLFWSPAASRSDWVLKEVRYALDRAEKDAFGRPEIRPVIMPGPPVDPPSDLKGLHFDDGLRYFAR